MGLFQILSVCACFIVLYSTDLFKPVYACVPNVYNLKRNYIVSLLEMHNVTTQVQKNFHNCQEKLNTYKQKQNLFDNVE